MIYFARAEGTEFVKIGFTEGAVTQRLQTLQTGCMHKLVLEATVAGGVAEERFIHSKLHRHRTQGEWFSLTPEFVREFLYSNQQLRDIDKQVKSFRDFIINGRDSMKSYGRGLQVLTPAYEVLFGVRVEHLFSRLLDEFSERTFLKTAAYIAACCNIAYSASLVEAAHAYYKHLVSENADLRLRREALCNAYIAHTELQQRLAADRLELDRQYAEVSAAILQVYGRTDV